MTTPLPRDIAPDAAFRELLARVGVFAQSLPWAVSSTIVLIVGVAKIGPLGIGPGWLSWVRESNISLPEPYNWVSSGLGPVLLMRLTGNVSDPIWWLAGAAVAALVLVVLLFLLRDSVWRLPILIICVLSPAFSLSISMIGYGDLFTLLGILLVVVGQKKLTLILGALLLPLGNPEQAFVMASCVFLVAATLTDDTLRIRSTITLVWSFCYLVGVLTWFRIFGVQGDRLDLITNPSLFVSHLSNFVRVWPLALYAALGGLWIVLFVVIALYRWRTSMRLLLAILVIPLIAQIATYDGTRDFVFTSTGALAALLVYTWRTSWRLRPPAPALVGGLLVLLLLTPTVLIDGGGTFRLPYADLLMFFGI